MSERCTWSSCAQDGVSPQVAKNGQRWACLCQEHAALLDEACDTGRSDWTPKRMVGTWIKAQGGANVAAQRVLSGSPQ